MSNTFKFYLQVFLLGFVIIKKIWFPDFLAWTERYLILQAVINFTIFLLAVNLIARIIKYYYSKKFHLKKGEKDNVHFGIENISKVLIGIVFIVSVFAAFGVEIKELITSISIVAAAIAIISKDIVFDFLIGLYHSFTFDFEIGDFVKIGSSKGKIVEIGLQKVRFQNEDDDIVIIPNSKIYASEIINYTKKDIRLISVDFQLDLNLISNIEQLEKELAVALISFQEFIEQKSYNLRVIEMKKDYIDFKFLYRIKKLDLDLQREIRKKTIRKVFNYISKKDKI